MYKLVFKEPGVEDEELAQLCIQVPRCCGLRELTLNVVQGFVVLDRPELAGEEEGAGGAPNLFQEPLLRISKRGRSRSRGY